jgi:hypothetical protein
VCEHSQPSDAIAALQRWEQHGGLWHVSRLTELEAVVELRTCHGEAADELRSHDAAFLSYLGSRERSDAAAPSSTGSAGARSGGPSAEELGKASFPASDPPACWTWEIGDAGRRASP